jgi:polo-like kinase 1
LLCCEQLQTEIKIHRSISHRHVVKFNDVFEDKDNVYILMEVSPSSLVHVLELHAACYVPSQRAL